LSLNQLPESWRVALEDEFRLDYFQSLQAFVERERQQHTVFPGGEQTLAAFQFTPLDQVRVVLLGQDPYHGEGQANGLCFSVGRGVKSPPSLVNIFKELQSDVGCQIPNHGDLKSWASQGVLLLNTVLTVRESEANSHRRQGWERFTDRVIEIINAQSRSVIFILWGKPAQKKESLIDTEKHTILKSSHPSPLSSYRGFFGSKPFTKVNQCLIENREQPIDWALGD